MLSSPARRRLPVRASRCKTLPVAAARVWLGRVTTTDTKPAGARPAGDSSAVGHRIRAAAAVFGWSELRPGQFQAVEAAVAGTDVLAVLPTGYGKSAIYQLAGMLVDGPTVVISPLISLQADQVARINRTLGAPRAVAINSAIGDREIEKAWESLVAGAAEFIFLSPEQLANDDVLGRLKRLLPRLVVVDEAHCVSSWGHDFRPDYLRLGPIIDSLSGATVIALTATGSSPVRQEIIDSLHLSEPLLVTRGFDRPNLRLEVELWESDAAKRGAVIEKVCGLPLPGLLYVATRADTDRYAEALAERGVRAAAYSGGLTPTRRARVHEAFTAGDVDVVVATSAFGMGIDKPNVRFVVHASVTYSVDDYYQEMGRAGRDGQPALVALFYRREDLGLRRFFAATAPSVDSVTALVSRLEDAGVVNAAQLASDLGMSPRKVTALLSLLMEADVIRTSARGVRLARSVSVQQAVERGAATADQRERIDNSRIEMIRGYAETGGCRRQYLLGYFGEQSPDACGNCDACSEDEQDQRLQSEGEGADESETDGPFPLQSRVRHRSWGDGVVMRNEDDRVTVFFEDEGYKVLSLSAVRARKLLRAIT